MRPRLALFMAPLWLFSAYACNNNEGTTFSGTPKKGSQAYISAADASAEPVPTNAIVKGSFTIFTFPEDPQPFEDYSIVIRVDLKGKAANSQYSREDLSGDIKGTDDFVYRLGESEDENFFVSGANKNAFLVVLIPGAEGEIRDTINIKSKLLDEKQTITITF